MIYFNINLLIFLTSIGYEMNIIIKMKYLILKSSIIF